MKLTGLFLGAGASYELGMPLVWELTAEVRAWLTPEKFRTLNAQWRRQGEGFPDAVQEDFCAVLTNPSLHYESILGHLEVQYRRHRQLAQPYHGLYGWFVELVYHLLYYRQVNNSPFLAYNLRYFDGIKALVDTQSCLWVFSLNHDLMVEAVAARHAIALHSGFGPETVTLQRRDAAGRPIGEITAAALTEYQLEHGVLHFPNPPQPGINLLKIHGALDVFTFNDGKDLLKLLPAGDGVEAAIAVLRQANEDLVFPAPVPGGRIKAINEIAYADQHGEMQFLRRSLLAGAFKFDERTSQVLPKSLLKHFRANLNFVGKLVCIGYSFGDQHINAALRHWLEFSAEREIEIVNPGIREVPGFLLHLSPQVTLSALGAAAWLDVQAGIVRTEKERISVIVATRLRALGKDGAARALNAFAAERQTRVHDGLIARLEALPQIDGQPDFSQLGDPNETAKRWVAELLPDPDSWMEELMAYLQDLTQT